MILIAAAALAASTPEPPRASAGATVEATATIRVISGVQLSWGGAQSDPEIPTPRETTIHTADAHEQPAKLFEFQ